MSAPHPKLDLDELQSQWDADPHSSNIAAIVPDLIARLRAADALRATLQPLLDGSDDETAYEGAAYALAAYDEVCNGK